MFVLADRNPNIVVFTMFLPIISNATPVASTKCVSIFFSSKEGILSLSVLTNTEPSSFNPDVRSTTFAKVSSRTTTYFGS